MAFAFSTVLLVLLLAPSLLLHTSAGEPFDVRQHLCTVTRYDAVKDSNNANFVPSTIPDGCKAIHLNLVGEPYCNSKVTPCALGVTPPSNLAVGCPCFDIPLLGYGFVSPLLLANFENSLMARHGTRSPTKKRIKELDRLAIRLDTLLNDARVSQKDSSLLNIPKWLSGWQSPWNGREKGGELIIKGEDELYHLGIRVRERFPELFDEEYHPDIFSVRATQVPRASASAVAFGMGLFSGKGSLGPGRHRAFSVLSESRASDILLRFYDTCETYKEYRRSQEPAVEKLKEPILDEITSSLVTRYRLNFTRQDVASLWFLCKQEASLLESTDQACALFSAYEVSLLEWTDDLEVFLLKGYGKAINYRMGVPLLQEVFQSMEQAIMAKEENHAAGTFEKARLRFAHAETVVPFICLLGLFLEESEFEQIRREQPLSLPPKPPQKRNWRGSIVAPFSGNNMLALYQCSVNNSTGIMLSGVHRSKYFVQVLHNEIPTPLPGCSNTDFCPYEVFKERVVNPHLKHDFHSVCNVKLELPEAKIEQIKSCSLTRKLINLFHRLFVLERSNTYTKNQNTEL